MDKVKKKDKIQKFKKLDKIEKKINKNDLKWPIKNEKRGFLLAMLAVAHVRLFSTHHNCTLKATLIFIQKHRLIHALWQKL